jgi:hypothetical protein
MISKEFGAATLIKKEDKIQKRAVAKSYMTNSLLIWLNICAFPHILGSSSSDSNRSHLNFLIDEENVIFFFIIVVSCQHAKEQRPDSPRS